MITVHGSNVSAAMLDTIQLQRPKHAGQYWEGIPHSTLVDTLRESCQSRGWKIAEEKYALSKDCADLAGGFNLRAPDIRMPDGMDLGLGFLTSNAMRKRLTVSVGGWVRVCQNGLVTGDIVVCKKHTINLELSEQIENGLDEYKEKADKIADVVDRLKEKQLTRLDSDSLIMTAGREKIVPWGYIPYVEEEYRSPKFDYGTDGKTAWDLMNAFTHVVKGTPPLGQMNRMVQFTDLLLGSLALKN